jgi:hypothetical protein
MQSTTKAGLEIAVALLLILTLGTAEAHPNLGVPCSACHTQRTGKLTISGNDTAIALSDRLDGGSPDLLKVFTVRPGGSVDLTIDVNDGAVFYDPVILNLDGPGVENELSNQLAFTKDPTWEGDFFQSFTALFRVQARGASMDHADFLYLSPERFARNAE